MCIRDRSFGKGQDFLDFFCNNEASSSSSSDRSKIEELSRVCGLGLLPIREESEFAESEFVVSMADSRTTSEAAYTSVSSMLHKVAIRIRSAADKFGGRLVKPAETIVNLASLKRAGSKCGRIPVTEDELDAIAKIGEVHEEKQSRKNTATTAEPAIAGSVQ